MKMNENTNGQFITIFKRTIYKYKQNKTYTNAIKENNKPHILGINQRLA